MNDSVQQLSQSTTVQPYSWDGILIDFIKTYNINPNILKKVRFSLI